MTVVLWLVTQQQPRMMSLSIPCRQARMDSISPEALQVGSPAFLPENSSFGKHYYLAALVPLVPEPPQDLGTLTPQLIPTHVGPRYAKPGKHFACLPSTGPFEGLILGVLLGRGSFGRVYRGLWKGQLVGVKVNICLWLRTSLILLPTLASSAAVVSKTQNLICCSSERHGLYQLKFRTPPVQDRCRCNRQSPVVKWSCGLRHMAAQTG